MLPSLTKLALATDGKRKRTHPENDRRQGEALMRAAYAGDLEVVQNLIKAGADVNAPPTTYGGSALMRASREGHAAVVAALLAAGADVNMADNDGWTALMSASHDGHTAVVNMLLAAGADVHAADRWGATALMHASKMSHVNIVAALLAAGANVNRASSDGNTALMWARTLDRPEIVALLKRHIRMRHLQKQLYVFSRMYFMARRWKLRAIERLYAPGGAGYLTMQREFETLQRQGAHTGLTLAQFVAMRVKGARDAITPALHC
jgi:ankyrin repeat protein